VKGVLEFSNKTIVNFCNNLSKNIKVFEKNADIYNNNTNKREKGVKNDRNY